MASQEDHVAMFRTFIRANGNSENVCNLYWKRVRTFLSKHPEAMELDKDALKGLVDDYISTIPITSGIEVTATAVRYYWTMRFKVADFFGQLKQDSKRDLLASEVGFQPLPSK